MRICWMTGPQEWAFKVICERYAGALPGYEHVFNDPAGADVVFSVTPTQLMTLAEKKKIVLHLDSLRALQR